MAVSPSRLIEPIIARDCSVILSWTSSDSSSVTSTWAPTNCDLADLADLDAGQPHDGAGLEALHVREARLQVVALPRQAALAADHEGEEHGDGERRDDEDAELELGPGERAGTGHGELSARRYDRKLWRYGSREARSSWTSPSKAMTPSRSMMNSVSATLAGSAGTSRTSPSSRTAVCSAT